MWDWLSAVNVSALISYYRYAGCPLKLPNYETRYLFYFWWNQSLCSPATMIPGNRKHNARKERNTLGKQNFMQLSRQRADPLTCWAAMDNTNRWLRLWARAHPSPSASPSSSRSPGHGQCIQIVQIVCECELSTVFNFGSPRYLGTAASAVPHATIEWAARPRPRARPKPQCTLTREDPSRAPAESNRRGEGGTHYYVCMYILSHNRKLRGLC